VQVRFEWYPGFSLAQRRKSIRALHAAALPLTGVPVLEVSSKSEDELGVALSAFNLRVVHPSAGRIPLESAFQGSKVFAEGGPFLDLLQKPPSVAKRDRRVRGSGTLVAFRVGEEEWPTTPLTAFYDWLYLGALRADELLAARVVEYRAFSDIEFNPRRSINCQARSCALFVALSLGEALDEALLSKDRFLAQAERAYVSKAVT